MWQWRADNYRHLSLEMAVILYHVSKLYFSGFGGFLFSCLMNGILNFGGKDGGDNKLLRECFR